MYENIKFEIVPAEINLPAESKQSLEQSFSGFFSDAEKLKERAAEITDPAEARTARLEVKKLRIDADKKRKLLKEDSLRMGKAIDGANNILLSLIVPIEKGLEAIEKEAERAEAARLESIRQERIAILEAMSHEPHGVDIAALHVDQWEAYLQDAKDLQAIKAERENKEQAEAEAAAKAEADRLDKHRLDNIRLKAEAEAAAKEKAKADAIAAKERVRLIAEAAKEKAKADEASKAAATAQAKIEAIKAAEVQKLKSAKAESDAALQAEREAKQKVESAPDKARLYSFAHQVRSMIVPTAKTTQGEKVASDVSDKIKGFANWIENQADTL